MSAALPEIDVRIDVDRSIWISPESYWQPTRIVLSAWLEHAPFAFWIAQAARPASFVELGTHNGFSFYTFCEAARRLRLPMRAWALDTWQGDDHAGFYGEEIFAEVNGVRAETYPDMAVLLRGYFEDSVNDFEDGSIDLLHIDGRHGYEDVKADYDSWLPKVSAKGIVLFHDIAEHEGGFGVWRLWDELKTLYPSFTFHHGHGLGVLCVGEDAPAAVVAFCNATESEADEVRDFYSSQGQLMTNHYLRDLEVANLRAEIDALNAARDSAVRERDAIVGSYSWTITAPVRRVAAAVPAGARRGVRATAGRVRGLFRR